MWKFISNEPNENEYQSEATEIHNEQIQNKKRSTTKYSTKHNLQRKRQRTVDYRDKYFHYFKLIIVNPPPNPESEESNIISSSFGISRGNQSNEVISKMVLTHILKRWEESKVQSHTRFSVMAPSEKNLLRFVALF